MLPQNGIVLRGDVASSLSTMSLCEGLVMQLDSDFDILKNIVPYFIRFRGWASMEEISTYGCVPFLLNCAAASSCWSSCVYVCVPPRARRVAAPAVFSPLPSPPPSPAPAPAPSLRGSVPCAFSPGWFATIKTKKKNRCRYSTSERETKNIRETMSHAISQVTGDGESASAGDAPAKASVAPADSDESRWTPPPGQGRAKE